ncbi:MAG: nuclear transport factor 2 family protein [Gammaproteobacteria bacterium]|nr:nuclear transport factor 2 family protein [Gammaproteobacteria bacterium]
MKGHRQISRQAFLRGALLALLASPAAAQPLTRSQKSFEAFCDLFYRQKRVRAAFEAHVVVDYIQHSAGMAQGREAAIAVLEPMFSRPEFRITPLRTLWDRDLSSVILDVQAGDAVRAIVVDIFRHAQGKIVEHWDVKAELAPGQRDTYFSGFGR